MTKNPTTNEAVRTVSLGKRYGRFWALEGCTINIPKGSIAALVGPNGAGKTTLLKLLAGMNRPSKGSVEVLGHKPEQTAHYLSETGYVAQEIPLYKQFTARQHLAIGAHMDDKWDNGLALQRLSELGIPLHRPVGKLSGGQRAQVGLAMALAKRPKLLLLDEPVAALDPLARDEFLTSLTQAVADAAGELTVMMSSHLLADLERVCDYLTILATGHTQLCGDIDDILERHKLLVGSPRTATSHPAYRIIKESHSAGQTNLLVRLEDPTFKSNEWQIHAADIEEIVLAYMSQHKGGTR